MPVINVPSPFGEAMNALGAFADAYTEKQRYNTEQKHRAAREATQDSQWNKDYQLRQATTQSDLETAAQNRKIAAAKEEFDAKMRPIELEKAHWQEVAAKNDADAGPARKRLLELQIQEQQIKTSIAQKYGIKLADLDVERKKAEIASTKAGTANTEAATALTQAETSNVRSGRGLGGTGTAGGKPSMATQVLQAIDELSPQGLQLYQKITSQPTTLGDALLQIRAASLPPEDKKRLELIFSSSRGGLETPHQAASDTRKTDET